MVLCQNCGAQQPANAAFCEECGAAIQRTSNASLAYAGGTLRSDVPHPPTQPVMADAAPRRCARCQAELEPDSVFCHMCGAPVAVPDGADTSGTRQVPPVGRTEVIKLQAAQVVQLTVKETQTPVRIPEQQPVMVLGRNDPIGKVYPDIDLTPHGGATLGVSRRHARLFFDSGQLFIEDLQSTNLTRVNGEPLTPGEPCVVQSGDEIRLGKLSLVVAIA